MGGVPVLRAVALAVLLVAGCTGNPGAASATATLVAGAAPTAAPTARPTVPSTPSPSPVANGAYTAADEAIAELIRTGASEAIPPLQVLNDMDPDKLEDLFVPLGVWITTQKASVETHTPSGCTADAVTMFIEGLDAYDAIREKFLAWRDWGAHGHAFHPEAPRQAAALFDEALVELGANCSA